MRRPLLHRWLGRWLSIDRWAAEYLGELISRYRWLVIATIGAAVVAALLEGATVGVFGMAVHSLSGGPDQLLGSDFGWLGELADDWKRTRGRAYLFMIFVGLAVVAQLLRSLFRFAGQAAAAIFLARAEGRTRRLIFDQCMAMCFSQASRYPVGDLASQMEHVNFLGLATQRLNTLLGQIVLLGVYVSLLVFLSWKVTAIAVVVAILVALTLRSLVRSVRRYATNFKQEVVRIAELTVEYIGGLRVLHSLGRESWAAQRIHGVIERSVRARSRALTRQALVTPVTESLSVIAVGAFLMIGAGLIGTTDSARLARFATYLLIIYRLAPRLAVVNKEWSLLNNYLPFLERITDFLRSDDKTYPAIGDVQFRQLEQGITFDSVSFSYEAGADPVLRDISFKLGKGETVALVGESGSGKSTLSDLLLRLYSPSSGRILVDGVDLDRLSWDDWREIIGVVSQDTFLLNDSIRNNIALGRPDADLSEIVAAADAANATDFITDLENGFDTVIGNRGYRLSGGQRQRLAIARALLRNPQLLILDEATSELDSRSEQRIQQALETLRSGRTVLVIAHRLGTIQRADRILVLRAGRISERGNHGELLQQNGEYAHLWHAQSNRPPDRSALAEKK